MIRVIFSEQDLKKINRLWEHHPDRRVRKRMHVLWLKALGLAHQEICQIVGISNTTLRKYLRMFLQGGVEKLMQFNYCIPTSAMEEYRGLLESYFREHPPATIREAMAAIEKLTGIKRSPSAVGRFLHALGMHPRKVGAIPAKADPQEQEDFKNSKLDPLLEEAKQSKRIVLFVDAAHFVLAPLLGILWSFTRLFIKGSAGRQRFNVLGALNAITHELIMTTNDSYINAQSVCDLLRKISLRYIEVPITLVLDNARYQKCQMVKEFAASLNIELLYLPSYSPNLNLIERLWKFVKKEVLYSKYYPDFSIFKRAILDCLNQTHTTHKKALDSLLTLKFQTFKKSSILAI